MNEKTESDPLHGVTLANMLEQLVSYYGWGELGIHVKIRCFNSNPSISSSLAFLRKTEWARAKVQQLFLDMLAEKNGLSVPTPKLKPKPIEKTTSKAKAKSSSTTTPFKSKPKTKTFNWPTS